MKYFVIGKDGSKYGPADVATIRQWREEGRLVDDTWLEEEESGNRHQAQAILGTPETIPPPSDPGPQVSPYPRHGQYATAPTGDGRTEITVGWILNVLGLCCCALCFLSPLANIAGLVLGYIAKKKGHPGAQALIITSIVVVVLELAVVAFLVFGVFGIQEFSMYPD